MPLLDFFRKNGYYPNLIDLGLSKSVDNLKSDREKISRRLCRIYCPISKLTEMNHNKDVFLSELRIIQKGKERKKKRIRSSPPTPLSNDHKPWGWDEVKDEDNSDNHELDDVFELAFKKLKEDNPYCQTDDLLVEHLQDDTSIDPPQDILSLPEEDEVDDFHQYQEEDESYSYISPEREDTDEENEYSLMFREERKRAASTDLSWSGKSRKLLDGSKEHNAMDPVDNDEEDESFLNITDPAAFLAFINK